MFPASLDHDRPNSPPKGSFDRYNPSQIQLNDCASVESSTTAFKKHGALDLTQRIEKKLAEYNSSQNVIKRWLFEILSWLVSAMCMATVVGIYAYVKNRPMAEVVSLLTYANVAGKVASAALIVPTSEALGQLKWNWFHQSRAMWDFEIFDKASRGPLGAVMLLFRTKGRSLAALGAILIVLLLAIDTFFQQVTEFPGGISLEATISTIPRTRWYQPSLGKIYREGADMNVSDNDISLVVEKFSYGNGTQPIPYGNGTRPEIPLVSTHPSLNTINTP
jgi:hypothetical protein